MGRAELITTGLWPVLRPYFVLLVAFMATALLKQHFAGDLRYQAACAARVVSGAPPEVDPAAFSRRLTAPVGLPATLSIFDAGAPQRLAASFEGLPWVRRVRAVRRRFPASFDVAVELRRPVAVLCVGAERLALDAEGVVVERDTVFGPPSVVEIRTPGEGIDRVPRVGGVVWQDGVLEALGVARVLDAHREHAALESVRPVEVSVGQRSRPRRSGGADVRIRLACGVWLRWGRSPVSPRAALELPVERKLAHLESALTRFPGLLGLSEVDLRYEDLRVVAH